MAEMVKKKEKDKTKIDVLGYLMKHIVTVIFIVICIAGIIIAGQPPYFLVSQILERISRNSFLVLALIVPVIAGMGLNFAIIIGAMAGQIAIIVAANYRIAGPGGLVFVMALSVPIAIVFGILVGRLLNKTRGQEMITSMIVGFFANGLYQFVFLFLAGAVIPIAYTQMLIPGGRGIRNTVDLSGVEKINDFGLTSDGLKYSLDGLWKMGVFNILFICALIAFIYAIVVYFNKQITQALKLKEDSFLYNVITPDVVYYSKKKQIIKIVFWAVVLAFAFAVEYMGFGPKDLQAIRKIKFPLITGAVIALVALFNTVITSTKIGQDFRTVGHDQHVAKVSGINVDRVRVIAIVISMILAAWGQIILLQNVGVLNTYGSHMQIGLFSVAALLVGGASVTKATNKQAFLGVLLFHTLFIVSPTAGKNLFGDPQIGEFFRAFVAYGVIGLSLGLYAWKRAMSKSEI